MHESVDLPLDGLKPLLNALTELTCYLEKNLSRKIKHIIDSH